VSYKRYECPSHPNLTMFGRGGPKEFSSGVFITNDSVKQECIEQSDVFEIPEGIFLTGEDDTAAGLAAKVTTIVDDLVPPRFDVHAHHPEVEIGEDGSVVIHETDQHPGVIKGLDGKLRALPRLGDSLDDVEAENTLLELTPEQRISIAFLAAGFPPGTELDPIAQELGIDLDAVGTAPELADIVEEKLAPLIADRQRRVDAAAPPEPPGVPLPAPAGELPTATANTEPAAEAAPSDPGERYIPGRTAIRRGKQAELVDIARLHAIPGREAWIDDLKEMRKALLKHFHDIEE